MLIVIAGPSGVGKGTVIRHLRQKMPDLQLAVSSTTRPPRDGEVDGEDYYFLSEEDFLKQDFLEWAMVHDYKYGTPNLDYQGDFIFEVDVQGAQAIKDKRPGSVTIFLEPPSWQELERRLRGRKTESPERLARRLVTAKEELQIKAKHDYTIVNEDLAETVAKIIDIIKKEQSFRKEA